MKPTELHELFSDKEQTLLVSTEPARLKKLSEDDLDDLLGRVRRARNKYTKLYRRQAAEQVRSSRARSTTGSSNQRSKRKAEIFEDALARVARSLGTAARATARELKAERIAAAEAVKSGHQSSGAGAKKKVKRPTRKVAGKDQKGAGRGASKGGAASKARQASRAAAGARNQARRDSK